ncbi:sodium/hydrogen exchanger 7 domain protein [Dictyocaulus viviparus]|uniref:Sodium/hydrogen exchanger n=1 Tax=Dictyocaulus viviparus TaxID=29172 RepID=A0A0D8XEC0_DICVI|nr:sodium/hydrogen exchanger 7 domain protein [Dictyocaulus viviparus]
MFVHETGLTLFYGLLIGIVIRYFDIGLLQSQTFDVILKGRKLVKEPPDYLRLEVEPESGPHVSFHYELMEGFYADKKKHNEQKIEQKSAFSPEIFFNILLPPIIFNAGYSLKKRHFFRNIGSILAFVFVGTTISCFSTGCMMYGFTKMFGMGFSFQELLFFGAVISATDPVTVISLFADMNVEADLFAIVFGESALNDAVAIVLSNTIDNFSAESEVGSHELLFALGKFGYIFFGSLFLGSFLGCGNALITKMTAIAEHPLLESSLFVLVSYISFLLGEVVGLTGIVSVLFCGISQAHYTYNNLSEESQLTTKQFFQMISFVLESFIFCYIGVSVFVANNQKWNLVFLIFSLISINISRALFVYPLSFLLNIRRRPCIPTSYQHMLVFSGLRGAMAFALADRNTATDNRQIICSTTAAIVMITVFFNGSMTAWMIEYLGIK